MEIILAVVGAPIYMQIFPIGLFLWAVIDLATKVKIVQVKVPADLPKDLQKALENEIKKQIKNKKEEGKDDN